MEINSRIFINGSIVYVVFIINLISGHLNTPEEERSFWLLKIIIILQNNLLIVIGSISRVRKIINKCLRIFSILIVISFLSVFVDNWIQEYVIHMVCLQLIFNIQVMINCFYKISMFLNLFLKSY